MCRQISRHIEQEKLLNEEVAKLKDLNDKMGYYRIIFDWDETGYDTFYTKYPEELLGGCAAGITDIDGGVEENTEMCRRDPSI